MESSVVTEQVIEGDVLDLTAPARRSLLMKGLGKWLKERGISQTFAAEVLGLHRGHLSNLIRGEHVPSPEICQNVLKLMSTTETSPRAVSAPEPTPTEPSIEEQMTAPVTPSVESAPPPVPTPVRPPAIRYRRSLCAGEVTAVGSIVKAYIATKGSMTADEVVAVTKAVVEGFR